jgi:predicted metal-binding protein
VLPLLISQVRHHGRLMGLHLHHAPTHPYPVRMTHFAGIRRMPWKTIILLCGKCARKIDGGYGAKRENTLKEALCAELQGTGRRREVRVIETRCMGICPKKAVTALNASRPSLILTIPKGTGAAVALAQLTEAERTLFPTEP